MEKVLKCKFCGKEFKTNHPNKIFCSRACLIKYHNGQRARIEGEEGEHCRMLKKCLWCGVPIDNKKDYCSSEHRKAYTDMKAQLRYCEKCIYSLKLEIGLIICDYLNKTGHRRPCGVNPCTVYIKNN